MCVVAWRAFVDVGVLVDGGGDEMEGGHYWRERNLYMSVGTWGAVCLLP